MQRHASRTLCWLVFVLTAVASNRGPDGLAMAAPPPKPSESIPTPLVTPGATVRTETTTKATIVESRRPVKPVYDGFSLNWIVDTSRSNLETRSSDKGLALAEASVLLLAPTDQASVLTFSTNAQLAVEPMKAGSTAAVEEMRKRLKRINRAWGLTNPEPALRALVEMARAGRVVQGAALLTSDGWLDLEGTQSDSNMRKIAACRRRCLELAKELFGLGLRVYTISVVEGDPVFMTELAEAGGGTFLHVDTAADLPGAFGQIFSRLGASVAQAQKTVLPEHSRVPVLQQEIAAGDRSLAIAVLGQHAGREVTVEASQQADGTQVPAMDRSGGDDYVACKFDVSKLAPGSRLNVVLTNRGGREREYQIIASRETGFQMTELGAPHQMVAGRAEPIWVAVDTKRDEAGSRQGQQPWMVLAEARERDSSDKSSTVTSSLVPATVPGGAVVRQVTATGTLRLETPGRYEVTFKTVAAGDHALLLAPPRRQDVLVIPAPQAVSQAVGLPASHPVTVPARAETNKAIRTSSTVSPAPRPCMQVFTEIMRGPTPAMARHPLLVRARVQSPDAAGSVVRCWLARPGDATEPRTDASIELVPVGSDTWESPAGALVPPKGGRWLVTVEASNETTRCVATTTCEVLSAPELLVRVMPPRGYPGMRFTVTPEVRCGATPLSSEVTKLQVRVLQGDREVQPEGSDTRSADYQFIPEMAGRMTVLASEDGLGLATTVSATVLPETMATSPSRIVLPGSVPVTDWLTGVTLELAAAPGKYLLVTTCSAGLTASLRPPEVTLTPGRRCRVQFQMTEREARGTFRDTEQHILLLAAGTGPVEGRRVQARIEVIGPAKPLGASLGGMWAGLREIGGKVGEEFLVPLAKAGAIGGLVLLGFWGRNQLRKRHPREGRATLRSCRMPAGSPFTVGRSGRALISIEDPSLQPVHVTFLPADGGRFSVTSEDPLAGIEVDGHIVEDIERLGETHTIKLSDSVSLSWNQPEPGKSVLLGIMQEPAAYGVAAQEVVH